MILYNFIVQKYKLLISHLYELYSLMSNIRYTSYNFIILESTYKMNIWNLYELYSFISNYKYLSYN